MERDNHPRFTLKVQSPEMNYFSKGLQHGNSNLMCLCAKTGSLNSGIGHFNSVILTGTLLAVGTQGLKEVTDPH
jgi:hypothetical protein